MNRHKKKNNWIAQTGLFYLFTFLCEEMGIEWQMTKLNSSGNILIRDMYEQRMERYIEFFYNILEG